VLAALRPDPSHYPSVELSEELSDVGPLVIVAPTPENRIQLVYQFPRIHRRASAGKLAHLLLETENRLLARVRIQRSRRSTPTQSSVGRLPWPSPLDQIAQKLKADPNVHDPRFLRMKLHAEPSRIRRASEIAARASAADSQVITQSSAYLVS
jgi:hypothetical protein